MTGANRTEHKTVDGADGGSTLVPMLVWGLVLVVAGMLGVILFVQVT
ncbi:MAG: hypothetical protein LPL00_03035 [Alphaproteobacteria bacterium]|nr:hypothetical protein [Alphaproteobacteria bacterium]MDX5368416.1 hypothetical protein [Alphaproteobacteria bacterium]MDX5463211.1 hypothetical protein [Alphaproteobacteria bacterium]